ncbi:hypothetical protein SELMODRAFT_167271 [Selaginella moellendorffii]|uniref:RING-type E3 ubiquitin transferase n=1 Tax=Selaginella moellendorffii TaxID=88036 RepID=D8R2D4_SELML|nr:U-box domain-containing protein 43 [Selaginella moellendorffii]EFJ33707.1 hypothetical protein SELMODRAFT_167271 [Selaginella moellendorffii]|eukprot:XP_002964869.1 U-box domain-containing protein 43 [Selaginella moellendorffii]
MLPGRFGGVVLAPVSELLARVLVQIAETVVAAKDVLIEKESFSQLARYLEKIRPLLVELQDKIADDVPPLRKSLETLSKEMRKSQELIAHCSSKSKIYLLINCRSIVSQVQGITQEIGRCLSLVPMASMNLSADTRQNAMGLLQDMQSAQFKATLAGEEIVGMIENGVRTRRLDSNFSNDLLLQIAHAVGVPVNPVALRQELLQFKKEKEEIELHKDQAEAYQLEQIIGILNAADAATTAAEKESTYRRKKSFGGIHALPPLQTFCCPITQEVMEDPVEIASGQIFERSAISKWFSAGKRTCPTTKVELDSLEVKPNFALRQSIEEWKERNVIIGIGVARSKILSDNQDDIHSGLRDLQKLSEEKSLHRYWIASERLIPEIVRLLKDGGRDTRRRALETLCSLAKSDEIKEEITAESAIPIIARSLARDVGESRQAVALLLELSKIPTSLEQIGKAQGCILLLVAMLRSENSSAVEDARQLLANLSGTDANVIQMAEANHFGPLISRLDEGSDATKILMATALSEMSLTDESKATLGKTGAIQPLASMLSSGKPEFQQPALGALASLSTYPSNREAMIAANVLPPLLQLLFSIASVVMALKVQAAATIANISSWDGSVAGDQGDVVDKFRILQSEDTVARLLAMLKLTDPSVQAHILYGLVAMCSRSSAKTLRLSLRHAGAMALLISLFLEAEDQEVRTGSLKLVFWISRDTTGKDLASHVDSPCMEALVKFITSSQDAGASSAALGIIGILPQADAQVMRLLQQARVLPAAIDALSEALSRISTKEPYNTLLENVAGALLLFTNPSNVEVQTQAAGVIPSLVRLLEVGTPLARSRAATALGQFSENSGKLSSRAPASRGCCSLFGPRRDLGCPVHGGKCSVRSSFCLVEAWAIAPLVQTLGNEDGLVHEAALGALTTLLYDDTWENGVHVIAQAQGVRPVVRLLTSGSAGAKEKAVWMLEKFFRFREYQEEYGRAAQMPLIDLTQRGSASTRQLAAKILAHLNVLHDQSSYF